MDMENIVNVENGNNNINETQHAEHEHNHLTDEPEHAHGCCCHEHEHNHLTAESEHIHGECCHEYEYGHHHDDCCGHEHTHTHEHHRDDCCEHDHAHEHHHNSDCCEHDHEHSHGHTYDVQGFETVESHSHEGASISSIVKTTNLNYDEAYKKMNSAIEALRDELNNNGHIIGHLKGFIKESGEITTFSTVGADLTIQKHPGTGLQISFTAIVFGPSEEELKDMLVNCFKEI